MLKKERKLYSQHDEELVIEEFFGNRIGRFLDIGAFNGITYSNVYPLAMKNWSGVCLEPAVIFENLRQNYAKFPKVILSKVGLAEYDGKKKFYETDGNAISTTELKHKEIWEPAGGHFRETEIEVISWQTLISKYGSDFNFISLDIEGNSVDIFKLIPYEEFKQLELICVEHDDRQSEVVLPGFKRHHLNGLNVFLRRI